MTRHTGALVGLFVGITLGLAGAFGGFGAFIIVLVLGAVGTLIGLVVDGSVDVTEMFGGRRERRDR